MEFILQILAQLMPAVEEEPTLNQEMVESHQEVLAKGLTQDVIVDSNEQEDINLFGVMEFH